MALGKKISEIVTKLTKIKGTERLVVADEGTNKYLELSQLATSEQLKTKRDEVALIDGGNGIVTQEIQPNKYYSFGECTTLKITLATPQNTGIYNEYKFGFTSGATPTQFYYPESIIFDKELIIEANKYYMVEIFDNKVTFKSWEV